MDALIIGSGPAGLMAADRLSAAGHSVLVAEAKPSLGRKFLMAGKSGLNITMDEPTETFKTRYFEAIPKLAPMLTAFDNAAAMAWARGLDQEIFTGSSARVFPKAMKASPLLRAWLRRLDAQGVEVATRHRWVGWDGKGHRFETPEGPKTLMAKVVIFALGGASWARLGSDGAWATIFRDEGIPLAPFQPMNMGLRCDWSPHMAPHFGAALKPLSLHIPHHQHRGEVVLTRKGLEGSGIYALARALRAGRPLAFDLIPDLGEGEAAKRIAAQPQKASLKEKLRKALKLSPAKIALAQECAHPLPREADALAALLKALPIAYSGVAPLDEAISTAGGVPFDALTEDLALTAKPDHFIAGEMLDWEAPTGGYLITACLAMGAWAAEGALKRLNAA